MEDEGELCPIHNSGSRMTDWREEIRVRRHPICFGFADNMGVLGKGTRAPELLTNILISEGAEIGFIILRKKVEWISKEEPWEIGFSGDELQGDNLRENVMGSGFCATRRNQKMETFLCENELLRCVEE